MKKFVVLQYRWKRLRYPSQVVLKRHHPLHGVHLELEHTDHIVHALIDDVLAVKNKFDLEDLYRLLDRYREIGVKVEKIENCALVRDYQHYIACTTELLQGASDVLKAS